MTLALLKRGISQLIDIDPAALYVATDGVDDAGRDGSINQPWATWAYAITQMVGGEHIYGRAGTYLESDLNIPAGNASSYSTFEGYPGETVIIDANQPAGTKVAAVRLRYDYTKAKNLSLKGGGGSEDGTLAIGLANGANTVICNHIIADGCTVYDTNVGGPHGGYNPAHIAVRGTVDDILVQNCEAYGADASGIKMDTRNITNVIVKNNHCHDCVLGISIKWGNTTNKNVQITYNKIHDTTSRGIPVEQSYTVIKHNLLYRIGSNGIRVNENNGGGNNCDIQFNTLVDCGIFLYNNAVAYDCIIKNNISYKRTGTGISDGMYGVLPYWVYATTVTGYNLGYFVDAPTTGGIYYNNSVTYTASGWEAFSGDDIGGNVQNDPLFTDYLNDDFTLSVGSPAIGTAEGGLNMGCDIANVGPQ